ncbi:MAG: DUF1861 family protein [Candidatus Taylorbacteria bacterium]|nr:DUF1861 family protein [Candidatus Taylorbacteria bacterium]
MYQNPEMQDAARQPRPARDLFEEFKMRERLPEGEPLVFEGVGGKDVYNITAPFTVGDRSYIAGRVEARESQNVKCDSETQFFEEKNGTWVPAHEAPTFRLEDPFVTRVWNELVFGGVETFPHPDARYSGGLGFRTVFYRGDTLQSLRLFTQGPGMMKDIRLIQLRNGEVAVFTRPQGPWVADAGRGKIGFTKLQNLDVLNAERILNAKIIEGQFMDHEWGGVNELHLLENRLIGALGHIAYADDGSRRHYYEGTKHYYAMAFVFDPDTSTQSPFRIIASRENFPEGPAKRSLELDDVIFPGGMIRNQDDNFATLYTGVSDAQAGRIIIPYPFSK